VKQAQGELQVSSQALLRERMTELKIDSRAPGGAGAGDLDERLRNLDKAELAKINRNL